MTIHARDEAYKDKKVIIKNVYREKTTIEDLKRTYLHKIQGDSFWRSMYKVDFYEKSGEDATKYNDSDLLKDIVKKSLMN